MSNRSNDLTADLLHDLAEEAAVTPPAEAGTPGAAGATAAGTPGAAGATAAGTPGAAGATAAGTPGAAGATAAGTPGAAGATAAAQTKPAEVAPSAGRTRPRPRPTPSATTSPAAQDIGSTSSPVVETSLYLSPKGWKRPGLRLSARSVTIAAGPVQVRLGRS